MSMSKALEVKLRARLAPTHLEVENESHMHAVAKGAETHFRVVLVSEVFQGLGRIDRHRLVHEALKAELAGGVHALALVLKTPAEWAAAPGAAPSPACLGGSKAERGAQ